MDRTDVVVIGAGVVGLAVARELALAGYGVVLLEAAADYGTGTSARNSEVIHAGIYYAPGSLKARLCVRGKSLLYEYAEARGVPHRRCGKLIVATGAGEEPRLDTIAERAAASGVHDLQRLSGAQARALEPQVQATAALLSPSTGIVDSHALMTALLGDAERAGALYACMSPFASARRDGDRWVFATAGAEPFQMSAGWLVNCAGLHAQRVARAMAGFPPEHVPRLHLAQGHYFSLAGRSPFSRLVYPVPVDGGLGVHFTVDLGGQAKFGPDVQWLGQDDPDVLDYQVDESRRAGFETDIRRYWPGLPAKALAPAYSGVRPKLSGPGEAAADFVIAGPAQHGCDGVVQLLGIESPGLTSCLAIGEWVAGLIGGAPAGA
ncbi:MAG: NAD(P)/FAD-dependent oxidoreductase [Rubrivivax sp.]|nr:NAD(P)/FAD-dependent oxidoreductase [Rubrivivax sp.]